MSENILLVDDDANLLRGLRRALHQQPYNLFTASSADLAKEMFWRQPFQLVVVDQHMPGTCGTEFLGWIEDNFPSTVRIMLSGKRDTEVVIDAINRGKIFRYLTKPCGEFDLAIAIREGLASIDRTETATT